MHTNMSRLNMNTGTGTMISTHKRQEGIRVDLQFPLGVGKGTIRLFGIRSEPG